MVACETGYSLFRLHFETYLPFLCEVGLLGCGPKLNAAAIMSGKVPVKNSAVEAAECSPLFVWFGTEDYVFNSLL